MQTIDLEKAVAMIPEGAIFMIGGFMGVGTPERVIDELVRQGKRGRPVIANDNALLGVELDVVANDSGRPRISTRSSRVGVWVIPTNEELMIARHTRRLIAG